MNREKNIVKIYQIKTKRYKFKLIRKKSFSLKCWDLSTPTLSTAVLLTCREIEELKTCLEKDDWFRIISVANTDLMIKIYNTDNGVNHNALLGLELALLIRGVREGSKWDQRSLVTLHLGSSDCFCSFDSSTLQVQRHIGITDVRKCCKFGMERCFL